MGLKRMLLSLSAAVLMFGCTKTEETKEELPVMHVVLENYYGNLRASWEAAGDDAEYEVKLYDRTESADGEASLVPFRTFTVYGTSAVLTDEVVWYLQELQTDSEQYPMDLVVGVTAYDGDKVISSGQSDPLRITDLFPPAQAPLLKEDIAPEDITLFTWTSSGDTAEMNFSYTVSFDEEEPMYYASYYGENGCTELEEQATEVFRNQLMDVILRGELYRVRVMDPEIEILDGGEEYYRIEWNGMNEGERRYYRLRFNEEDKEELTRILLYIRN